MRALLAGLLAALALSTSAMALPPEPFGVAIGGDLTNNAAAQPAEFARMRAGGVRSVRVDASWGYVQPTATTWQWEAYDALVANLARADMRWYPMLGYSAPWAASVPGDPFTPPASDAMFAAFAAEVARRYGTGGSFWLAHPELPYRPVLNYEVWNEPNYDMFWHGTGATAARYARLYVATRAVIHAQDPAARVVVGGVLDSYLDGKPWLSGVLASMTVAERAGVDALGWHPYQQEPDAIVSSTRAAASILTSYGLAGRPIEIAEVGFFAYQLPTPKKGKKVVVLDWAGRAARIYETTARIMTDVPSVTRFVPYVWGRDSTWGLAYPGGEGTAAYFDGIAAAYAGQAPRSTPLRKRAAR